MLCECVTENGEGGEGGGGFGRRDEDTRITELTRTRHGKCLVEMINQHSALAPDMVHALAYYHKLLADEK